MMEFLTTKTDKGEFNFGFNIRHKNALHGPYPWNKDRKAWRLVEWNIQINLFTVELIWNYVKEIK